MYFRVQTTWPLYALAATTTIDAAKLPLQNTAATTTNASTSILAIPDPYIFNIGRDTYQANNFRQPSLGVRSMSFGLSYAALRMWKITSERSASPSTQIARDQFPFQSLNLRIGMHVEDKPLQLVSVSQVGIMTWGCLNFVNKLGDGEMVPGFTLTRRSPVEGQGVWVVDVDVVAAGGDGEGELELREGIGVWEGLEVA